jgi:hypothetical protein
MEETRRQVEELVAKLRRAAEREPGKEEETV